MSISIWDYEKPLDAMMLSHDDMAALVLKHEQQIKDIAAHLLELQKYTEFKRSGWVGLTDDEKAYSNTNYLGKSAEAWQGGVEWAEAELKEKNGG